MSIRVMSESLDIPKTTLHRVLDSLVKLELLEVAYRRCSWHRLSHPGAGCLKIRYDDFHPHWNYSILPIQTA